MTKEEYIRIHRDDDVRRLALAPAEGLSGEERREALVQISGRQAARRKLPLWAATEGLLYPEHISLEQCSSEATARYKARLAARVADTGGDMADITGGMGVDFAALAPLFRKAFYIERQAALVALAGHNLPLLGVTNAETVSADGTQWLRETGRHFALIYADPARRSTSGARTYAIADCTPDISALLPLLLSKSDTVIVKLSPMLDHHKAVRDLAPHVGEVHIVASEGECKELLLVLRAAPTDTPTVYCANLSKNGEAPVSLLSGVGEAPASPERCIAEAVTSPLQDYSFLFEPNPAIMKAGCFALLCERYGVAEVSRWSHLFVSKTPVPDFPGRAFRIHTVTSLSRKELRRALTGITSANITCRGCPLTPDALRRRLGLRDGGEKYLFAAARADGATVLFVTTKL